MADGVHPADGRLPLRAWDAPLWCHLPADRPVDLGALAEAESAGERWNDPGRPTAYLASDPGVAIAEYGRHHDPDGWDGARRFLRLDVVVTGLVDLRRSDVLGILGIVGAPVAFMDRSVARATARRLRDGHGTAGLIVPSAAFLDQPERCNVVLFADAIPGDIEGVVRGWTDAGHLELGRPRRAADPVVGSAAGDPGWRTPAAG